MRGMLLATAIILALQGGSPTGKAPASPPPPSPKGSTGATRADATTEEKFQEANRLYERGLRARGEERETLLRSAAGLFEEILAKRGIHNGYLQYNLGNAYQMLGDIGRAILAYRRAERLVPGYDHLQENLRAAIEQRKDLEHGGQLGEIVRTLTLRRYWFDYPTTVTLFVLFFVSVWVLLAVRLFLRIPLFRTILVLCIALAGITGAAGVAYVASELRNRAGVILAEESEARKGPGESYDARFTTPLHAGTEFTLLDRRPGWWHVRLASGDDGWIPEGDAGLVVPR